MLGIPDPLVLSAYLGCIAVAAISVIYGLIRRNAGSDEVTQEDRTWAVDEKRVEDEL